MAPLLAKPSPLNINLGSDRFSMFNKKAGHPPVCCDKLIKFVKHNHLSSWTHPRFNTSRAL
jgi:hypothetical protein